MKANENFKQNLLDLKEFGEVIESRPKYKDGNQSKSISIKQIFEKYDLRKESVLHNYRPTAIKTAIQEMLWIYQDQTPNLDKARKRSINWWDEFDVGNNTIGVAYGNVVDKYKLIDKLLFELEKNPFSRRHIMSLWDIQSNKQQNSLNGLIPCAYETIWSVSPNYEVDMTLIQRSSDYITANAINKIQYVALLEMVCGHLRHETKLNYQPRIFSHYVNDLHIYDRHLEAVDELLEREPTEKEQGIILIKDKDFYDYTIEDFEIFKHKIKPIKSSLEIAI